MRDKLAVFLAPRDKRAEIPKQPKKENAKLLENVPLNRTFVPFINERGNVGHLIPLVRIIFMILVGPDRGGDEAEGL